MYILKKYQNIFMLMTAENLKSEMLGEKNMIKGYLSLSAYCMVHKEVLVQLLSYLLFRASDVDSEMYISNTGKQQFASYLHSY